MHQLLPYLVLGLLNQFALKSTFCVFVPSPLLIVHLGLETDSLGFSVLFLIGLISSVRAHLLLSIYRFEFILIDLQPVLKNLTHGHVLRVGLVCLFINKPVHMIVSSLVGLFDFVV